MHGQAAIKRDIDGLRQAISGLNFADAPIPADLPTCRRIDQDIDKFYPSREAYLYSVADAVREEYRAIAAAGLIVQLDLAAALAAGSRSGQVSCNDADENVEIINHALQGIPEEHVRYQPLLGQHEHASHS